MIAITGGAGFIGSCLTGYLFRKGAGPLLAVDDFSPKKKEKNWTRTERLTKIQRDEFFNWLERVKPELDFIFHLGARTDTTSDDTGLFDELNFRYSKRIWEYCCREQIPLIYASSAATYGDGSLGYSDDHALIPSLQPLNAYAKSKHRFDRWVLEEATDQPPNWYGLKFFNVYGPNEYHKGRMSSMVFHAFNQIKNTGSVKLFRSHKKGVKDGHQQRDFIWVFDVLKVMDFLYTQKPASGIYNVGTGQPRTFLDLVGAVYSAMDKKPQIDFIDTPTDIRPNYQYYTSAEMDKLRRAGFNHSFTDLETGVREYVREYLVEEGYY
ncbi:MAG: ADP-glyceromanno-heptose 6-epimerase [Saprospirales bacterium]|nr:MAG: ADP-glyceromanno-heptose 6-epimerase [Saprospirales bacterium]